MALAVSPQNPLARSEILKVSGFWEFSDFFLDGGARSGRCWGIFSASASFWEKKLPLSQSRVYFEFSACVREISCLLFGGSGSFLK